MDHEFRLKNASDGGLIVDIRIPYHQFSKDQS
jgi:hypothetical protein